MEFPLPVHRLEPVIAPLLRAILQRELGDEATLDEQMLCRTVKSMMDKVSEMPRFMGVGIAALTVVFDADGIRFGGSRFRSNPPAVQQAQAAAWRASTGPLLPDFMDFYGKMGVFVYWSHVCGEATVPADGEH